MLSCLWVSVPLGQTVVYNVYDVLFLAMSYQKVVWLHVSVDEVVIMQKLKSLDHLICNHQSGLDRELPFAVVEKVL